MSTGLNGKFIGKVVQGVDPLQRGRYLVHVYTQQPHQAESAGIWCTNSIHSSRVTDSGKGMYGSYCPLHPGTTVQVECDQDDWNTARVTKIVSDQNPKSDLDVGFIAGVIPTGSGSTDGGRDTYAYKDSGKKSANERDEQYIIMVTPTRSTIYINEATGKDPNALFIVYKGKETALRMNADGIHISTDGNSRQRIVVNQEIVINGSSSIDVTGGNYDINVTGDVNLKASGKINHEAGGDINIKAGGNVNIDGSSVNLNSGMAASASPVKTPVCKL